MVAVTVLTGSEDKKSLLEAGFDDYIIKPYMIEELGAIIDRLLGRKFELCSALAVQRIH